VLSSRWLLDSLYDSCGYGACLSEESRFTTHPMDMMTWTVDMWSWQVDTVVEGSWLCIWDT
jgi:hypothetical protein